MAYSNDIRLKVLAAVDRGESQASVARRFEIGEKTLRRLKQRREETGDVSAYKTGPKQPMKLTADDDALMREQVRVKPGVTAKELVVLLEGKVVISTVCRRLIALGLPLKKKSLIAAEQKRPDVVEHRRNYTIATRFVDPGSLVFLDETGAKTNMTRLYGRAPVGERCVDDTPHGHWKTMTLLSAMRLDGVMREATAVYDGPMNRDTFVDYVEYQLAPALRPGDVVVMDNLSSHKDAAVRRLIENAGADLWYLPAYSPDLNPIEKLWSKVKSWLRRVMADTYAGVVNAIADALRAVDAQECAAYLRACGYGQ